MSSHFIFINSVCSTDNRYFYKSVLFSFYPIMLFIMNPSTKHFNLIASHFVLLHFLIALHREKPSEIQLGSTAPFGRVVMQSIATSFQLIYWTIHLYFFILRIASPSQSFTLWFLILLVVIK